jgi:hypothetical protein
LHSSSYLSSKKKRASAIAASWQRNWQRHGPTLPRRYRPRALLRQLIEDLFLRRLVIAGADQALIVQRLQFLEPLLWRLGLAGVRRGLIGGSRRLLG